MNPWIGISIVMITLMVVIHGLSRIQEKIQNAEIIRKILHVTMGLITLTFPWVFTETWPVLTLSIVASLFIGLLKASSMNQWQPIVCAQGRKSIGEIVFPLAIGLTFLLADGDKVLYLVPIVILTLADTASAIVGQRFGRKRFSGTGDTEKSFEGSLAFAGVAFLSTYFALNYFTSLPSDHALAMAMILAMVAMMFEAIAWRGLDNLFIPLGSLVVLQTHITLTLETLHLRLSLLFLVSLFIFFTRRNSTLNGSAIVGTALFCYFAYIMGGIEWVIMPVLLFLTYRFLLPSRFRQIKSTHNIYAVISVASAGIFWLLLSFKSQSEEFLFPYMLTFAAHAAIIGTAHMRFTRFSKPKIFALLFAVLKAWCLIALPILFFLPASQSVAVALFLTPFCIGIPTALFYAVNSTELKPFTRPTRWWKQASFAAMASLLGLIPLIVN